MKCFDNSHVLELRSIAGLIASFILATACEAELQTTIANTYTLQSGAQVVWRAGSTTLSAGNTSVIISGGLVQNPSGSMPIFSGNAFTANSGGTLQLNGTSPETL